MNAPTSISTLFALDPQDADPAQALFVAQWLSRFAKTEPVELRYVGQLLEDIESELKSLIEKREEEAAERNAEVRRWA